DILNTPGITLQQILERQQTINQQQSSNIQLGTAGASIINAFNNVKFTRTLATGIPGLPNVGALPYSTRPLFERGTPIFDRDTSRGLDAAAKQLANEFVNTKDGLSRIEEASRAISEEG